jgi:hypothetical protein
LDGAADYGQMAPAEAKAEHGMECRCSVGDVRGSRALGVSPLAGEFCSGRTQHCPEWAGQQSPRTLVVVFLAFWAARKSSYGPPKEPGRIRYICHLRSKEAV